MTRSTAKGVSPRALAGVLFAVLLAGLAIGAWYFLRPDEPDSNGPVALTDFDPESTATVSLAGVIPSAATLARPLGVVGDGELLYVALADGSAIATFGYDGSRSETITLPPAEGAAVASPIDLALLSDGRLAVVDAGGERVVTVDPEDPATVPEFFGPSTGDNTILKPTAIAVADGAVYVADSADASVREYDESGEFVRRIEIADPALTFVGGLLAHGDALYVADSNANRVLIVDLASGAQKATFGRRLDLPRGIAVGEGGEVWIAEAFGGRVSRYDATGQTLTEIIGDDLDEDIEPGDALQAPEALVWDEATSRLYVTDPILGRILVYNVRQEVSE